MVNSTFTSFWKVKDKVYIDGDKSVIAYVIGFMFSEYSKQVQVAYFANGISYEVWINERRLTEAN